MGLIKKRFDDCPYNCNVNGMVLDDNMGKLVPCPYCSKIRAGMLKSGEAIDDETEQAIPIWEALGIKNNQYLSDRFVYETVIPEKELVYLSEETINKQKEISEEVYLGLTVGTLPETSICFGLTRVGDSEKFAYPMLAKAYASGLSVGKLYTAREINEGFLDQTIKSSELYGVDFLMLFFSEDSDNACAHTVQGVLQGRSLRSKPTVIVTTAKIEACSQFLGYYNNTSLSLATPVFVEYNAHKGKHSRYINNLLGVENCNIQSDGNESGIYYSDKQPAKAKSGTTMSDLLRD